MDLAGSQYFLK